MHAIQRWYFGGTDAEEIARVAKERSPFEQIGTFIGARVACDGVGTVMVRQKTSGCVKICGGVSRQKQVSKSAS